MVTLYTPLPHDAARQLDEAIGIFSEYRRVRALAQPYAGSSMYWKRDGTREYLVQTRPGLRSNERLGLRSEATERLFADYMAPKLALEGQLQSLREALVEAEYQNKGRRVGRAPGIVVSVLRALDDAGLHQRFTVWGIHAVLAYEVAARVLVAIKISARQEPAGFPNGDLCLKLLTLLPEMDHATLQALKRADRTFERATGPGAGAVNARGFAVQLIAEEAPFAPGLAGSERFEHPVVAATGRMAMMRTLAPQAFVQCARASAPDAPASVAPRPVSPRHADCVQALLDQGLLRR
jgi:hypothetical protein